MTSDESLSTEPATPCAGCNALRQELDALKALGQSAFEDPRQQPSTPENLTPAEALEALQENPVLFIQTLIENAASNHLADLRDEAEFNGALRAMGRQHAEFARFAPYVIQETLAIMNADNDGVIAPWHELLEQGYRAFQKKFQETIRETPALASDTASANSAPAAFVEGRSNREAPTEPPSFTRNEIARMSLADFLKNESAIEDALKHRRIR
ncbi:MAG: hypothetical protein IPK79_11535 [Vampirovibrionales bacterium]|nr:hypothetical protein [Vampirovibrionales bacterium]